MDATLQAGRSRADAQFAIRLWLFAVAGLVVAIVIVGGATRLTESGLSITEWKPVLGALPPIGEAQWLAEFEKYRQIPQYSLVNRGMSLDEFKVIYWWEWGHRLLGRVIGLAFVIPLLGFWAAGRIDRALAPRLVALLALGAAQGVLGWYMVMSGLVDRVSVSQYRLAAHLTLAIVIFAAIVWVALGVGRERGRVTATRAGTVGLALLGLVLMQVAAGGFVAGLRAGMGYNTWPLIDGAIIPAGLGVMEPWWRNLFENALTVQFVHRMLAYALVLAALANAAVLWRRDPGGLGSSAMLLAAALLVQSAIGIATLLEQVPMGLALAHQAGGLIVVAAAVWHLHLAAVNPVGVRTAGSLHPR
ncbi:MAG TPA: COX15/CtaA family protein [Aestuariivirgaceae bacterium]|nr:COX15/CtaA family protein [Aestuariivirgaceae bacterium]